MPKATKPQTRPQKKIIRQQPQNTLRDSINASLDAIGLRVDEIRTETQERLYEIGELASEQAESDRRVRAEAIAAIANQTDALLAGVRDHLRTLADERAQRQTAADRSHEIAQLRQQTRDFLAGLGWR